MSRYTYIAYLVKYHCATRNITVQQNADKDVFSFVPACSGRHNHTSTRRLTAHLQGLAAADRSMLAAGSTERTLTTTLYMTLFKRSTERR
jgi:hypothetical protein